MVVVKKVTERENGNMIEITNNSFMFAQRKFQHHFGLTRSQFDFLSVNQIKKLAV